MLPSGRGVDGHLFLYLLAVGILTALTPWAIVGMVVMLGSRAGAPAAVAFTLGWFCAVTLIAAVVAVGLGGAGDSSTSHVSTAVYAGETGLGIVLVGAGLRMRSHAGAAAGPAREPAWLRKLDTIGPVVAFAFGTFMINVVFVVDAGVRIAASGASARQGAVAVLFYALVSTAALLAVLVVYAADRAAADARLRAMRGWIARHNATLTAAIVLAVGAVLALRGLVGLLG